MRCSTLLTFVFATVAPSAEPVFEDSPALTALWQASSDGSTDAFINQIIQNRDSANERSADGRGPMFWAYEFKNVDSLALLMHLGVSSDQEDVDGKSATLFFPDEETARMEFEADAKAKAEELGQLLSEREEEFYAYQSQPTPDQGGDYDDEDEELETAPKKAAVDEIDYADDEDDEAGKEEM